MTIVSKRPRSAPLVAKYRCELCSWGGHNRTAYAYHLKTSQHVMTEAVAKLHLRGWRQVKTASDILAAAKVPFEVVTVPDHDNPDRRANRTRQAGNFVPRAVAEAIAEWTTLPPFAKRGVENQLAGYLRVMFAGADWSKA